MNQAQTPRLILILAFCSLSCQQPSEIAQQQLDFFTIFGSSGSSNYAGIFESALQRGIDGTNTWRISALGAHARLRDTSGNPYIATGVIKINTDTLISGVAPLLSSWPNQHIWQVNDAGPLGSFYDTVQPPNLFSISFPKQLMQQDSVSLSSGFTVTYSSTGSDSIRIVLVNNSMLAHQLDSNAAANLQDAFYISPVLTNTGSFFIPSSELTSFDAPGVIDVYVAAQKSKVSLHGGRQYLYRTNVVSQVSTFTKP